MKFMLMRQRLACSFFARAMDAAVYTCNDVADVQAWLDHCKLAERFDRIQSESAPRKRYASILRMRNTHAPFLRPWYEEVVPDTDITTP